MRRTEEEIVRGLPLYRDGSAGSLWRADSSWAAILAGSLPLADNCFVRASDLLAIIGELTHGTQKNGTDKQRPGN
jgi:hypothetical protein